VQDAIDESIRCKNEMRKQDNLPPLEPWCRKFALLQEITKAAMKRICGEITVVHTVERRRMDQYSVSSFYSVGIHLGVVDESRDLVDYVT